MFALIAIFALVVIVCMPMVVLFTMADTSSAWSLENTYQDKGIVSGVSALHFQHKEAISRMMASPKYQAIKARRNLHRLVCA